MQEMACVVALARSVQPLSHWEERIGSDVNDFDHDAKTAVYHDDLYGCGETHGMFVIHGARRLLCWYRMEYDGEGEELSFIRELVACPLSSVTHHSQARPRTPDK